MMKNANFCFHQLLGSLKTIEPAFFAKIYYKNLDLMKNSLNLERKWFSLEEIEQFYQETFSTK